MSEGQLIKDRIFKYYNLCELITLNVYASAKFESL